MLTEAKYILIIEISFSFINLYDIVNIITKDEHWIDCSKQK